MDRNKTYLVLNYSNSPVAVQTRNESFIIDGGSATEPSSVPFSIDEIAQINSNSPLFKTGILRFESEFEEEIYEEIRIRDWRNILTDAQIEDIILHPTIDGLQKIIDIQLELYFERIYGAYIGLMNANYPIRENVKTVMNARRKEFKNNQRISKIVLTKSKPENTQEIDKLKQEIEDLKKALLSQAAQTEQQVQKTQEAKNDTAPKTKAKSTTKSTTKPKGRPKGKTTKNK